jgi:hypothetical protein
LGSTVTATLKEPTKFGVYTVDQPTLVIEDFVPHELCALIFELEFDVSISGS